jgi:IclR family transcriptional regulator, acetate operon repressor
LTRAFRLIYVSGDRRKCVVVAAKRHGVRILGRAGMTDGMPRILKRTERSEHRSDPTMKTVAGEPESRSSTAKPEAAQYSIRAVDRVCDILDVIGASDGGAALRDIAAACGMPKSSALRYLSALERRRYVERIGEGSTFRLGSALFVGKPNTIERLRVVAHPLLERLRDDIEETVNLGVLDGDEIAYLDIVESLHGVRLAARPETRDPLYCTALGKAILAELPEAEAHALVGESFRARTPRSLTSWQELQRELARVRSQGYAVDDEENEVGGRCIGIAIQGGRAAISLSAPSVRLTPDLVAGQAARLARTAREIETSLAI